MRTFLCLLLLAATSFGWGRIALWRVRFAREAEEFVFCSALGLAVLSYATLLLGAVGWMTPLTVALAFAAGCLVAVVPCARFLGRIWRRPTRLDFLATSCLAVLVAAAALNAIVTLNPILEVDAYEYHVTAPKAWLLEGRILPVPYCFQANYHFLTEMLNVIALSLSRNDVILCKLIQWYSGVLLAVATWCFGRSFFSARVAWVAAAVTYMVKEIAWISATAYIDLTVGLFVWLGVFAMVRAAHLRGPAYHALAGVFLGCGFAAKQSGALFIAIAYAAYAAVLLLDERRRARLCHWPAQAFLAGAVAALVASPWMIKNYAFTGDPFYPFVIGAFDVPHEYAQPAASFTGYYGGLKRYILWDRETWPQLVSAFENFRTNVMYSGANMLVVWLLICGLIVIVCHCRTSLAWRLLVAVGAVAAPWFAWVTSRFLLGFFPVYVLALVQTLRLATGRFRWLFALSAAILLIFYGRTFVRYNYSDRHVKSLVQTGGPIFSASAREKWLRRENPPYPTIMRVNGALSRKDRLLVCDGFAAAPWLDRSFLPNPHSYTDNVLLVLWERFGDLDAMRQWLERERITHVLIDRATAEALDSRSGFVRVHLERLFDESWLVLYRLRPLDAPSGP